MKYTVSIVFLVIQIAVQSAVFAMSAGDPIKNLRRAINHGAKAKFTFHIIDSEGHAVSNATVSVGFVMLNEKSNRVVGCTDSNGVFTAENVAQWEAGARVEKPGFYDSIWRTFLAEDEQCVSNGCWRPWNPTIPIVLREIRNPIPMYVKHVDGIFPNGETAGFDCEKGDFVMPYGSGKNEDFRVALSVDGVPYKHTTQTISLSALDSDGGFRIMKSHASSAFKSEHLAPEQGYASNLVATSVHDVKSGTTGSVLYGGDEYLVFKSRIVRDEDGNVISANYGKVYGPIVYGRGDDKMETASLGFLYYFNPTPNDRNLEFDGKNNLFKPDWNSNLNWSREP